MASATPLSSAERCASIPAHLTHCYVQPNALRSVSEQLDCRSLAKPLMDQRPEDLSVKAERSQDSGDQLSPVAEDSPQESHFRPGEIDVHAGASIAGTRPDRE